MNSYLKRKVFYGGLTVAFIVCRIVSKAVLDGLVETHHADTHRKERDITNILMSGLVKSQGTSSSEYTFHDILTQPTHHIKSHGYVFDCSTIPQIKSKAQHSAGVSKVGYVGNFKGDIIFKIMSRDENSTTECTDILEKGEKRPRCEIPPEMEISHSITILRHTSQRKLVSLLGFCMESDFNLDSKFASQGPIPIIQFVNINSFEDLIDLHSKEKFKYSLKLVYLLKSMEGFSVKSLHNSGSQMLKNLVFVNSRLNILDLGRYHSSTSLCLKDENCEYDKLACDIRRRLCSENNSAGIANMTLKILTLLIAPLDFPPGSRATRSIQELKDYILLKNVTLNGLENRLSDVYDKVISNKFNL